MISRPIANLIGVRVQHNCEFNIGPARGMRYTVKSKPVIPCSLTPDWNLITLPDHPS